MRVSLTGGAYEAKSLIANAQRCVNLYPEVNPGTDTPPAPVTHYPTPGLVLLAAGAVSGPFRCAYRASNGNLYGVIGQNVYAISASWSFTLLTTLSSGTNPVSMADNGLDMIIVDGTVNGYVVTLATNAVTTIVNVNFYGADRVDYLDTFFIFNRPGTNQFYISGSLAVTFDPLDIAAKSGYPDFIQGAAVIHREIWLIGTLTTEIWYNSGAADFTFQAMPGAFIEHGCVAKYSIAKQDLAIYWLSQDKEGQCLVIKGSGYQAKRISTHAIENAISTYSVVSDAIGFCYQQEGHVFYQLTFPTANKTWVYDEATELWHERAWSDANGNLNRHRANCAAFAYGKNVVGDWQNGNLYAYDLTVFTDNGNPVERIRGFPHLMNDGKRVFYRQFIADMAVGTDDGSDGSSAANPPLVSLRWSDTRGVTWGNPITASLGALGEYLTSIQFQRLGMARDRVFELSWSVNAKTALNGAFIDTKSSAT